MATDLAWLQAAGYLLDGRARLRWTQNGWLALRSTVSPETLAVWRLGGAVVFLSPLGVPLLCRAAQAMFMGVDGPSIEILLDVEAP